MKHESTGQLCYAGAGVPAALLQRLDLLQNALLLVEAEGVVLYAVLEVVYVLVNVLDCTWSRTWTQERAGADGT
jgi:hypothetical protein